MWWRMRFEGGVSWLTGLMVCVLLISMADADVPVNASLETMSISSMTSFDCEGTITQSNTIAWQQSGTSLHEPPLIPGGFFTVWFDQFGNPVYGWTADPMLAELLGETVPPGEVRYTAGYSAITLAAQGTTHQTRMVDVDIANKAGNDNNIDINTHLAFVAENPFGRVISDEDLLIDAAGTHTTAESPTLCPYTIVESLFIPPFCNVVQMGSSIDLSQGSVTTSAGARFVSESSTSPVTMDYSIAGGGISSSERGNSMTGSMSSYIRAHLQEGRMAEITPFNPDAPPDTPRGFVPVQSADDTYSESTTARGAIALFAKEMHFLSGTG